MSSYSNSDFSYVLVLGIYDSTNILLVPDTEIYTKKTQPASILKINSDNEGLISSLSF